MTTSGSKLFNSDTFIWPSRLVRPAGSGMTVTVGPWRWQASAMPVEVSDFEVALVHFAEGSGQTDNADKQPA